MDQLWKRNTLAPRGRERVTRGVGRHDQRECAADRATCCNAGGEGKQRLEACHDLAVAQLEVHRQLEALQQRRPRRMLLQRESSARRRSEGKKGGEKGGREGEVL